MRAAKALASLCICTCVHEPSLLGNAIRTKISRSGLFTHASELCQLWRDCFDGQDPLSLLRVTNPVKSPMLLSLLYVGSILQRLNTRKPIMGGERLLQLVMHQTPESIERSK